MHEQLQYYIKKWLLLPTSESFETNSSILQQVLYQTKPAMLKIAKVTEEQRSGSLMKYWNGSFSAMVFELEGPALLLELLVSTPSLSVMAKTDDKKATAILCEAANKLHQSRDQSWPEAVPLNAWFTDLFSNAENYGSIFQNAADIATLILNENEHSTILHGDIHHQNLLHSPRGWLFIDPKGLRGPRGFDFANILCNPTHEIAIAEGRLEKQAAVIADISGLEINKVYQWAAAWSALSAVWMIEDGKDVQSITSLTEKCMLLI